MADQKGSLIITDFSRGWDPTHPSEQLTGSSQAEQIQITPGAPFKSDDVHDVDFWNGYLNKRNGKQGLGFALGNPALGLFNYFFTSLSGTVSRLLTSLSSGSFQYWNGTIWTALTLTWTNATYSYFETLKNLLFISSSKAGDNYANRWWDGVSTNLGYHGPRLSPFYLDFFGPTYSAVIISSFTGFAITLTASQKASGLYRGKKIWLFHSVVGNGFAEQAQISSFVTTGTPGTANYFVTSITIVDASKYNTSEYTSVLWNGCTMTSTTTGGTMTIVSPQTTVSILSVTEISSGGQRAVEMSFDIPVGTTCSWTLSNLKMSFGDGQLFGTDIPSAATTWYMTVPFNPQLTPTDPNSGPSQLYYKIPDNQGVSTDTSLGFNPMPNATTTFSILTNRNPNTDVTLIADTGTDAQGYFTGQVDVPFYKFSKAWQNFLVLFGDIWNPSSIWISAYGAPQVFGSQGGLDGAFIQVPNGNDGQVIVGAYVWRGDLYIFKTNSVYVLQFNGNTSLSPFNLTKLQGNFGPVSPGCIQEGDNYLYFLSPLGVCAISGLTVALLPENDDLRNKFTGLDTWNLSLMGNAQSIIFPLKKQIHFQVAIASLGDNVLVYDWERRTFWYNTGSTQETSYVQDLSSSPPIAYAGDSNGQLWKLDVPGLDEVIPIDFHYETPWLNFGSPTDWKQITNLWIGGDQQVAGTLNVEVYVDFNTKALTVLEFDMTDITFPIALQQESLNLRHKYFKFVLTNNEPNVLVALRFMRIDYVNQGNGL